MASALPGGLSPEAERFLTLVELDLCFTKRQKERIRAYILAAAPNREPDYYRRCDDTRWLLVLMEAVMDDRSEYLKLRTRIVNEICSEEGPPEYFMTVPAV